MRELLSQSAYRQIMCNCVSILNPSVRMGDMRWVGRMGDMRWGGEDGRQEVGWAGWVTGGGVGLVYRARPILLHLHMFVYN